MMSRKPIYKIIGLFMVILQNSFEFVKLFEISLGPLFYTLVKASFLFEAFFTLFLHLKSVGFEQEPTVRQENLEILIKAKGQITSKGLFGILGFFQKTNEQIPFLYC